MERDSIIFATQSKIYQILFNLKLMITDELFVILQLFVFEFN